MGKFKELMNEKLIVESSISRIWQHINNPSTIFAVISAYLNEKDDKLNHKQLRKDIKQLQLGYIEMDSGYSYKNKDTQIVVNEKFIYYNYMYSISLMEQMEKAMPKASYPSINKTDIENFKIKMPSFSVQNKIVTEINVLENKINSANKIIDNSNEKKQLILDKYLK